MPIIRLACVFLIGLILVKNGLHLTSWSFFGILGLIVIIAFASYEEGLLFNIYKDVRRRMSKWIPIIDANTCDGCNQCVLKCKAQGLQLIEKKAALTNPSICLSDGDCVSECPRGSIHMEWVEMKKADPHLIGTWRFETIEKERPSKKS